VTSFADVVIASRKLDACEAAAEQIRTSTGRQAVAIACHVGRWGDCDRLIAETLARAGRLDVLVNNAGMSPLYDSLDAVSEELFDKTLANAILPGPFRTDISKGWAPPEGAEVPFVPLGRMGLPAELTPLALHLASAASSYTTGAIIRVDGGITRKV
jgi:NAD(P)-dependent dehydrogenase (short-subunit alcohol dehydrogenase family)